jgi:hypothetical protein
MSEGEALECTLTYIPNKYTSIRVRHVKDGSLPKRIFVTEPKKDEKMERMEGKKNGK